MKTLLMGFLLSIVLFATPAFSADYYGQEAWQVPMGLSVGLSGNYGDCIGECSTALNSTAGLGLNVAYRPSLTFGVYLELLDNFLHTGDEADNTDASFIQANLGLNLYLFPANKFQPIITAGVGDLHLESGEQQSAFLGLGGEYIITDNMTIPFKLQYTKILLNDNKTSKGSLWNVVVGLNYYF